jgi:hypothetical protein
MKKDQVFGIAVTVLSILFVASTGRSADITAAGSGNWSSTIPDAPWPGGIVPSTNDSVDVESPHVITVDTNVTCAYIYGSGTVIMAADVTLDIMGDAAGAYGAQQLDVLNATAPGNTVNYHGNAFWAKRTDYHNLVFSGYGDFYNGLIPGYPATPMNIAGDMLLSGTNVAVQQGDNITIGGNLLIPGATNKWDCSSFFLTVGSNTVLTGTRALLVDLDGALGSNYFGGSMTVGSNILGWNVSDVIHWTIGGNLTNQGLIVGRGYGSIDFSGSGIITGKPLKLPTITVSGSYMVGTTITLTTNTPTLTGTLIFDLANTNKIFLQSYPTNPLTLYYSGALEVVNSGATPQAGNSYKFFSATNFGGTFDTTSFPALPDGLTWVDNLAVSGSIAVSSSGSPMLVLAMTNQVLTLSWDSTSFPGFSVQAQTNNNGIGSNWADTGSGTVSPFVISKDTSSRSVFFRLFKP